jgi:hypothetical protein
MDEELNALLGPSRSRRLTLNLPHNGAVDQGTHVRIFQCSFDHNRHSVAGPLRHRLVARSVSSCSVLAVPTLGWNGWLARC